jgi:hypothetical protein
MASIPRTRTLGDMSIASRSFSFTRLAAPKTSISCSAVPDQPFVVVRQGYGLFGQKMIDELNTRDPDGHLPQGNVDHTKLTSHLSPVLDWEYTSCLWTCRPLAGTMPILEGVPLQPLFSSPSNAVLNQLCEEAFTNFNTQFPEEISIANFLWEMREIAGLIPKIRNGLLKAAANSHLAIEFGWKPLVGDLRALFNVLGRVNDRIDYLRERYMKPTRLGITREIPFLPIGKVVSLSYLGSMRFEYTRSKTECIYHAGGELFHSLDWIFGTQARLRALLGAFGLTNPAKIVWNALPYSFVVDWFANISSLLTAYANLQDASGHWQLRRLCWSYKLKHTFTVEQVCEPNGSFATPRWRAPVGFFTFERYYRRKGLSAPSAFALTSPTTRQSALLAAMLVGKS